MGRRGVWILLAAIGTLVPVAAGAQPAPANERSWVIEGAAGRAEFADSPPVPHSVVGAGARIYVTDRLAIGPELTRMSGDGEHRDTFLTGNVTWDLRGRRPTVHINVVPYALAGGGLMAQTDELVTGTYTSTEGAFTAGGGLRVESSRGPYVAAEFRIGWEPHWRAGVLVGFRR